MAVFRDIFKNPSIGTTYRDVFGLPTTPGTGTLNDAWLLEDGSGYWETEAGDYYQLLVAPAGSTPTVQTTQVTQITVAPSPYVTPTVQEPAPVEPEPAPVAPSTTTAFTYTQTTPASEWSVLHPFAVQPVSLQVLVGGVPIIPDVLEYSDVRVVLAFGDASTGIVTLLK